MKVLYVHNSADIYGASRSLLRLLARLDRSRFQPSVVLPSDGPLRARIEQIDVEVLIDSTLAVIDRYAKKLPLFCYRFPKDVLWLNRLIRSRGFDLVHTNTAVMFSPGVSARLAGVPHIWHVRESFEEFPRVLWGVYSKYMQLFSTKIVCVSTAVAQQFRKNDKVIVIHNGFPAEEFAVDQAGLRNQFRKHFNIAETDFVAACIGRIKWKRKGQEFLVEAAAILERAGIAVTLLIVGSPWPGNEDHLVRLRALVAERGLQHRVIFAGELPDARPGYAACDVLVLPSAQCEPFGGVVMEAMCMSKPVIATSVGGSLDQVMDGQTGYLVPPADPAAIAEKIRLLVGDPTLRRRMGEAGFERIQTQFTLPQMVQKIEATYVEAVKQ